MNTVAIVNQTSGVKKKLKGQKYIKLIIYPSIKYVYFRIKENFYKM